MVPSPNKSIYLLLVAAIAAITWIGLQMIDAPPRAEREFAPEPFLKSVVRAPRPRRIVRVRESRPAAPPAKGQRNSSELDRVVVYESDFRPGEFDVAGVIRYLNWKLDARIQLSTGAQRARSRPVQLPAPRSTARAVLDRLVLVAGLRWELREGRIWISEPGEVA